MSATPLTKTRDAPADSNALTVRYQSVLERIREAERRYGRENGSVSLIAVSKTQPAIAIEAVHTLGQSAFGENHLQEAIDKPPGPEYFKVQIIQATQKVSATPGE